MVDVSAKGETVRTAVASGVIAMGEETLAQIESRRVAKGDVYEVARLAGIMGAKKTSDLIPLCHPIPMTSVAITIQPLSPSELEIRSECRTVGRTGVEMEALTAVSVACLTVYDMCKAMDRGMRITRIQLEEKTGGASGHFQRQG